MGDQEIIFATQSIQTKADLLDLLNDIRRFRLDNPNYYFRMSQLTYYSNVNRRRPSSYISFEIPKKSGGTRKISSPCGTLMAIQECLNEIFKVMYQPSDAVMGFTSGRSIITNASKHVNMNYVFNLDLKDFFSNIRQARVWKILQLPPFSFNWSTANMIAGLCCNINENGESVLPQGAPTSPILTNLICRDLDRRLSGLAKRFGATYTRYADDITFSSINNIYQEGGLFRKELIRIISEQGFQINEKKTRLQSKGDRQEVTGLIVNKKVNISRAYLRDLQSLIYIWERYGYKDAYARFLRKYNIDKAKRETNIKLEDVARGRLQFLKQVKGASDRQYKKLYSRFRKLVRKRKQEWSTEDFHYILWYRIPEFEKKFSTKIHFKYKPDHLVIPGVSRTTASCILFEKDTKISIPKTHDKVISKYIDTNDNSIRKELRTIYYVTLAQRGNDKFWILMKYAPYNYHQKKSINRTSHFA